MTDLIVNFLIWFSATGSVFTLLMMAFIKYKNHNTEARHRHPDNLRKKHINFKRRNSDDEDSYFIIKN